MSIVKPKLEDFFKRFNALHDKLKVKKPEFRKKIKDLEKMVEAVKGVDFVKTYNSAVGAHHSGMLGIFQSELSQTRQKYATLRNLKADTVVRIFKIIQEAEATLDPGATKQSG